MSKEKEYVKIHVKVERELYEKIWDITRREYIVPIKKFHIILNKILRLGIERYEEEEDRGGSQH